jgi:UDP-N-acetylmuramate--alanine ligase
VGSAVSLPPFILRLLYVLSLFWWFLSDDGHLLMTHIYLIGIGGSGMSAIAQVLLESGYTVSGSDRTLSPLAESLRAKGVRVWIGHGASQIDGADLVIRSSAIHDHNPEVVAARAAGIPVLKRADLIGQMMAGRIGIAVAGTHGKTTTTAMIAWMLTDLRQDPSYIVGSVIQNLGNNAHAGRGSAFVIEADEYDRMFLGLHPEIIIITNIEHDHPDCYPTLEEYQQAFLSFAGQLQPGGSLLACADDRGARDLLRALQADNRDTKAYGTDETVAGYQARNMVANSLGGFDFSAWYAPSNEPPVWLAKVSLQAPGRHNVLNALAALAAAHQLGLPVETAALALGTYHGTTRRFEIRGEVDGITVIDDYAHHPTEIRATLAAARARYPNQPIWAVWQPHTFSRTRALLADFAAAFNDADRVLVTEVYAARETSNNFSSASVVAAMQHPGVQFIASLENVASYLLSELHHGDVLLVLSAGDADQISTQVLAKLEERTGSYG